MMATTQQIAELDERIAAIRANLDDLTEQAAAYSGSGDEDRSSDRIAEQQSQLDALLKEREQALNEAQ
jgi:chaperonin cofactor prefoldin